MTFLPKTVPALAAVVGLLAWPAAAPAGPVPKVGDPMAALFKTLDTDGNGTLTRAEFAKLAQHKKKTGTAGPTTPPARPKSGTAKPGGRGASAFDRLDADHDGVLTLAEFRALAKTTGAKKKQK